MHHLMVLLIYKLHRTQMNKITVEFRSNYGNEAIYVVSDNAKAIRTLTKKKTIDRNDIEALQALGLTVVTHQSPYEASMACR